MTLPSFLKELMAIIFERELMVKDLSHLPEAESLQIALSKDRSMHLAQSLGVPVLETERCASAAPQPGLLDLVERLLWSH